MGSEHITNRALFIDHSTGSFRQRLKEAQRNAESQITEADLDLDAFHAASDEEQRQILTRTGPAVVEAVKAHTSFNVAAVALRASIDTAALIYDRDYESTGAEWQPPKAK